MSKEKDKHSSHFMTGVAVGAAVTALFTTATGRRLLKEITSQGAGLVEGSVDLEKIVDKVKRSDDEDSGEKSTSTSSKRKRTFRGVKK